MTIAAIAPVSGSSTKPNGMAVSPTASQGMLNVMCSFSPMPHAWSNAVSAKPQEPSIAAMAKPAARRPFCSPQVKAAASSGSRGMRAKVVVLILPLKCPWTPSPRF